jgi:hypothetical protein
MNLDIHRTVYPADRGFKIWTVISSNEKGFVLDKSHYILESPENWLRKPIEINSIVAVRADSHRRVVKEVYVIALIQDAVDHALSWVSLEPSRPLYDGDCDVTNPNLQISKPDTVSA